VQIAACNDLAVQSPIYQYCELLSSRELKLLQVR